MRWGHNHMGAKFLYQIWGPLTPIKHGLKSASDEPSLDLGYVHMLPTMTTKYVTCYAFLYLYTNKWCCICIGYPTHQIGRSL